MGKSFLFLRCQVRAAADRLGVAVPDGSVFRAGKSGARGLSWGEPARAPAHAIIECAAGVPQRLDDAQYAREKPYPNAATFEFRGAARYARVPTSEGWALWVEADVRSLAGLPADCDALMVVSPEPSRYPPGEGGPVNGPHLPWP
ncbi:MAG TPA: hypothetical protein VLW85_02765 [Myxococcales bacterium]|nr:hypothetical protein [Myxococcales bacterium]